MMARADDFGKVSLLKYPCIMKGGKLNVYKGHSSHVTCCRFSKYDNYLYSTGGED